MASVTDLAGAETELDCDPEAFRHQLEEEWAENNSYRWKQLAILTLIGNDWTIPNVARALKLNKNHLYRVVNNAKLKIKEYADNKGPNIDPSAPEISDD